MLSRALIFATVTLLIGCLAAIPVRAQNLDAGKSPAQIFSGTCSACHKGARGLLKTVPPGSLPGFLRQHYTTSGEMASQLSAFLIANGATDNRGAKPTQQAKDAKQAAPEQLDRFGRPVRPAPPQEAAKPEAESQQAAIAPGPDGRKSAAKQKLGKQPPKADAAKDEPAKGEAAKEETPKSETAREAAKEATQEDTAKLDAPKETGERTSLRPDPVPPVTPAPSMSAAISSGTTEPSAAPAPPLAMLPVPPPAVTASGPPLPPVPPAGPPAPPISQ
ncbi:MAG: hypothetical protein Q8L13_12875 [Bradyrhizobium sp.]|uniref:hypothetical protein n=1 Tax=Bradyrhizobium sp. TaxID=376 RepID=UPI0027322A0A|nr:hypothetical protein [Bradyrhizobium sp.]MDP1867219.1 hypothetical protein [Bradyrhizobium sp.]